MRDHKKTINFLKSELTGAIDNFRELVESGKFNFSIWKDCLNYCVCYTIVLNKKRQAEAYGILKQKIMKKPGK